MFVAACQLDIVWEDRSANLRAVEELLVGAKLERGSLAILPEMFASGFSMNVEGIAEEEGGPTQLFMSDLARRMGIYLMGGVVLRGAGRWGRNEAMAFAPDGGRIGRYCKMHPFTLAGEAELYEAGQGVEPFRWGKWEVAPFICYDLRFPEVFRAAARRGAGLMAVIANWPGSRAAQWRTLLQARAIENQAYVVGVNRCGSDPKAGYSGGSLIIDPWGEIVRDAGERQGIVSAEVNLGKLEEYRRAFPVLADARRDLLRG